MPFLGAGASLTASSTTAAVPPASLPSGRGLAYQLAECAGLPTDEIDTYDLLEVASCLARNSFHPNSA